MDNIPLHISIGSMNVSHQWSDGRDEQLIRTFETVEAAQSVSFLRTSSF